MEFLLLLEDPLSALRATDRDKTLYQWLKEAKNYHLIYALFSTILFSDKGHSVDLQDLRIDYATFAYFIKRGDKEVVRYFLQNKLVDFGDEIPSDPEKNLLFLACKRGWPDVVQELLAMPRKIDLPIMMEFFVDAPTIKSWEDKVQEHFPAHSIFNINVNSSDIWDNVRYCLSRMTIDAVLQLIPAYRSWVSVNFDTLGVTPLVSAIEAKRLDVVRTILSNPDVDTNAASSMRGMTPLMAAVLTRDLNIIKLLLDDERVDCQKKNSSGLTALRMAIWHEDCEVIKTLLQHKRVVIELGDINKLVKKAVITTDNFDVYITFAKALVERYI